MAHGVLLVESYPSSPDRADEFSKWYDDIHIPDVLALEGYVSARRYKPLDGNGPFLAMYDLEADDLSTLPAILFAAARDGSLPMSDCMQMDPPPTMRFLEVAAER